MVEDMHKKRIRVIFAIASQVGSSCYQAYQKRRALGRATSPTAPCRCRQRDERGVRGITKHIKSGEHSAGLLRLRLRAAASSGANEGFAVLPNKPNTGCHKKWHPVFGALGGARTHNNAVGGHDFIQLDYECGCAVVAVIILRNSAECKFLYVAFSALRLSAAQLFRVRLDYSQQNSYHLVHGLHGNKLV